MLIMKRIYFLGAGFLLLLFIILYAFYSSKEVKQHSLSSQQNRVIQVHPFLQQANDSSIAWVAITTERKTVEHLSNTGVTVLSPLIRKRTSNEPMYHLYGEVAFQDSTTIKSVVKLTDNGREITAAGEIIGGIQFFRSIRTLIGKTVLYALDFDINTPDQQKNKKKPTRSNNAYALYLKAKQKATAEQYDRAITCLREAIGFDSTFAMAYWAIARLYGEKGVGDSAVLWDKEAERIDPNHPKWAWRDSVNKEQPLKELLLFSAKQPFITVEKGIKYKQIVLSKYRLTALVWIIDPLIFDITMKLQNRNTGNYIADFLAGPDEVLALNGGFFEMDKSYSLSPSGLIIIKGITINPLTGYGGSGVFCMKTGTPDIRWSKDSVDFTRYDLAFQCGPVIVEPGGRQGIYNNSYRRLNRSAIGVSGGKVVLAIVAGDQGKGLSLYEFAEFLRIPQKQGGAGCGAALNLDGGSSTQVCFSYNNTAIGIQGLWAINSAIVVKKR